MVYFVLRLENVIENNCLQWVTSDPPLQITAINDRSAGGRNMHLRVPNLGRRIV